MSTKIYLAYRCSVKKLNEFLLKFREHCFSKVQERIEVLMAAVTPEQIRKYYDDKEWNMSYEEFLTKKEKYFRFRHVFVNACEASPNHYRDLIFCFDCSLNVWLHKNKAYLIPYGETWILNDFKLPEEVEEYPYWNNSDPPENVTNKQWEARSKNWDAVCLKNWNQSRLLHTVIDLKNDNFCLQPIADKILGKQLSFSACLYLGKDLKIEKLTDS